MAIAQSLTDRHGLAQSGAAFFDSPAENAVFIGPPEAMADCNDRLETSNPEAILPVIPHRPLNRVSFEHIAELNELL